MMGLGKQGAPDHKFQFQGVETERSFDLGWQETMFRNYDPVLGRFHQIDRLAPAFKLITPYHYAFNNPIMYNDPTGLMPSIGDFLNGLFQAAGSGSTTFSGDAVRKAYNSYKNANGNATIGRDSQGGFWLDYNDVGQVHHDANGNIAGASSFTPNRSERIETGGSISQVGIGEGFIPIWGSGREAYNSFAIGDYWGGAFNTAMAITDFIGLRTLAKGFIRGYTRGVVSSGGGSSNIVRVRHHTSPEVLSKIEKEGIKSGGRGGPFGVDVEMTPFGSPKTAPSDLMSRSGAYIEFDATLDELIDIPGTGTLTHNGRATARIPLTQSRQAADNTFLPLNNRNPKYVNWSKPWWKFW